MYNMNTVQRKALEDAQNGINISKDTQTAIRFIAVHYDKVIEQLRKIEQEKGNKQEKEEQSLEFNPEEIETLVYRENKFKQALSVETSGMPQIRKEDNTINKTNKAREERSE